MLLRWTAAAFAAIALAGLLTRLLPDTFPISSGFLPERVSFPLTYWNAMGIACALGALLALHLTRERSRAACRAGARRRARSPPIAVTLYLTFSRGAIWVLPIGLVLYVLLAQPRGLLTALPAAAIPAAIAVKVAYGAELLARADYDSSAAAPARAATSRWSCSPVRAGRRGAAGRRAAAGQAAGARSSSRREARLAARRRRRARRCSSARRAGRRAAPDLRRPRRRSARAATWSTRPICATRLTSAVDNGRIDNWRVALDGVRRAAAARHRRRHLPAHLGPRPPGAAGEGQRRPLALPGDAVGARRRRAGAAAGRARDDPGRRRCVRLGGPERHAYGAFVAGGDDARDPRRRSTGTGRCRRCSSGSSARAASRWRRAQRRASSASWAARRGGRRAGRARAGDHAGAVRLLAGRRWTAPSTRSRARDCATAIDAALTATERFGTRPEPWQVLGYCDARLGPVRARPARDGRRPRARPEQLAVAYGQAIVYGVSGLDPRPYAARGAAAEPARPARARAGAATSTAAKTAARRRRGHRAGRRFPSNDAEG